MEAEISLSPSIYTAKKLVIDFSCEHGCSSTIDDDTITDVARAMPRLESLELGGLPCQAPTGVTAKGLAALAHYCPNLWVLRIHIQVASLDPLAIPRTISDGEPTILREGRALAGLHVGKIPVPEEFALAVARTIARIFPCIKAVHYCDQSWGRVVDEMRRSRESGDRSGKESPSTAQINLSDPSPVATPEDST